ncbi:MAG: putative outer rane adhesin like protein [Myxococcaceae bacterium]|nr:putative outer rane adhesin like protein [Myxococcaceae bacterium]
MLGATRWATVAVIATAATGCQGYITGGHLDAVLPEDAGFEPKPVDAGFDPDTGEALDLGPLDVPLRPADRGTAVTDRGTVVTDRGAVVTDRGATAVDVPATGDPCLPFRGVDAGARIDLTATGARELRAFPGAEGFGAAATGGRGGRVIYVTNLNAAGPGSLLDAVQQTGPRYVLFKVSGVIQGEIHVRAGNLTIAGQTSPGGVTVRGFHTTEQPYCEHSCPASTRNVDNLVVRFIRSRPAGMSDDGMRLRYVRNAIIDHVSLGNANDEAMEISYSNTITVQNVLLAETVGEHYVYGGMLLNYSNPAAGYALDRLTIHHNIWNRIGGRMPEFSRESAAAANSTMQAELANNFWWDPRTYVDFNSTTTSGVESGPAIHYAINIVGNYAWARSGYGFGLFSLRDRTSQSPAFFSDNLMNLYNNRRDWQLNYCCNDLPSSPPPNSAPSWVRTARFDYPAVTYTPAAGLRTYVVANAGCFPRDPMDTRLMNAVRDGQPLSAGIDRNPANDALQVVAGAPAAAADRDSDGMSDEFECRNGLNPVVQDHNGAELSMRLVGVAGYTNLEVYLHELALTRVRDAAR